MNVRSTGLLLLLPLEGILLGFLFDAEALATLSGGWVGFLGRIAPRVMPLAASIATSGLILAGPRIRAELRSAPPVGRSPRRTEAWLAAHVAAFACLLLLSRLLFSSQTPRHHLGTYAFAWTLAAALTCLSWAAAVLRPYSVRVVVAHTWGLLVVSVACGLLAWAAGQYTQHWWGPLRRATLLTSATILRATDATAWSDPPNYLIGARAFTVEVNRQCSGYEGIGLACIALGAWFALDRGRFRFPRVLVLLPIAVTLVWLANAARIAALVFVGAHWSEAVALGGFHSYAGAILFSCVVLGTAWVAYRSPWFSKGSFRGPATTMTTERVANPAAAYLMPVLVITAATLVIGLLSRDGDNTFLPLRTLAGLAVLLYFGASARGWDVSPGAIPILAGAAIAVVWIGLTGTFDDPSVRPSVAAPAWRVLWLSCRLLGAIAVIPIAEELAFRGYLARRLMEHDFSTVRYTDLSWPAIVVSSLVYGALHQAFAAATVAGIGYALVARSRGRLADAILAHVVTNALLAGAALVAQFHAR